MISWFINLSSPIHVGISDGIWISVFQSVSCIAYVRAGLSSDSPAPEQSGRNCAAGDWSREFPGLWVPYSTRQVAKTRPAHRAIARNRQFSPIFPFRRSQKLYSIYKNSLTFSPFGFISYFTYARSLDLAFALPNQAPISSKSYLSALHSPDLKSLSTWENLVSHHKSLWFPSVRVLDLGDIPVALLS